jgi:hypothetical protein
MQHLVDVWGASLDPLIRHYGCRAEGKTWSNPDYRIVILVLTVEALPARLTHNPTLLGRLTLSWAPY